MHILTVLYGHPTDPAAFDEYYRTTHAPLVDPIPGVTAFTYRHCSSLDGNPPPYYLMAELTFDSMESLQSGMGSEAGQAAAGDVPNFATGGVTMFVAHD
ncbi:EthD family reductase [Actinomycetospora lutea]|uniref:EthD family reductase n=1 Tax=Actinomycetospora lutea TaxID=663604 RepID=UPI0023670242|nr:EthD family reductase [Actinomycetospora lutea]MDD7942175.1 EthD family reductase [Actinomycetospora lutea]